MGRTVTNAGRPVRIVGGLLDLTQQRQLEEQLYRSERLNAIGTLTAGVAHNFNNLLMVALPNLELLGRDVPAKHAQSVADCIDAAQRAADLVRKLMTYAGKRPRRRASPATWDHLSRGSSRCAPTPSTRACASRPTSIPACRPWLGIDSFDMGATERDRRHFAAIAAAMAKKEQAQVIADAQLSVEERLRRGFALSTSAVRMRGPSVAKRERPPSLVLLARERRPR
ncbi:MAG: hypothetical protein JNJ54_25925 [Myxococcaceae bacterium]|nr:hypothetical protein [Myxococcaceae bacterium]